MGVTMFSRDSYDNRPTVIVEQAAPQPPNPDPSKYQILKSEQSGRHLIVKIKYNNCTNYEGVKILVYQDTTLEELLDQKLIDPHFSENKKYLSPVARFAPNEMGWSLAVACTWDMTV